MSTFLKKLLVHLIIPLFLLCYVIYIGFVHNLYVTRYPVYPVRRLLIGEPYSENHMKWYKWQKELDNIKLIAIGSSRVLQFKSEFFSTPFFNLGYLVGTPKQTLQLIQTKKLKNKTIIISLDQWAFNTEWLLNYRGSFIEPSKPNFFKSCISASRVEDIIKFKLLPVLSSSKSNILKIGAAANIALDGITNDGSYYYGKIYQGLLTNDKNLVGKDYKFRNTKNRIMKGDNRFQHGQQCDLEALYDFENLVKYNLKQGNKVFYFFPPFAPTIQNLLVGDNFKYIVDASNKISQIAKINNVSFFDYTFFNSIDQMYIDGFHGGAMVYYKIAEAMGLKINKCSFINYFEITKEADLVDARKKLFTSFKLN